VSSIVWDGSNSLLISTGGGGVKAHGGQIQIWDAVHGTCTRVIQAHENSIHAFCVDQTGDIAASGSADATVKLWDWHRGRELATLGRHETLVFALAWSPGGEVLISGDSGGNLRVWDRESHRCLALIGNPSHSVFSLAFVDDHAFAAAAEGGLLTRYDLRAFDRAIAGNTEYWLDRIPSSEQDPARAQQLRQWAQRVLEEAER
jgi:WD40 repeat protein